MNKIVPGIYRHFKGNEYEVIDIAEHTETGEMLVVYKALYGEFRTFVRLDIVASKVDHDKYERLDKNIDLNM